MSLGGQGLGSEASTQQLVYGPDGRVYGSPAQARAAGVNQYYSEDGTPYAAQQGGPVGATPYAAQQGGPVGAVPRPYMGATPDVAMRSVRLAPEPVANELRMPNLAPEPVANEPRMMPDRMPQMGIGADGMPMPYMGATPDVFMRSVRPQMPMAVGGGLGGLLNNSRRTGVSPLQPSYAPFGGKGGSNSYSQSMGQMGYGSDPYSQIMSQMPIPQNPYGRSSGGALGGYDPSLYNNAFMGSNSRLNLSGLIGGGGMGGGGGDSGGGDSGSGAQQPGRSGPNVSFGPDNFMVANNVNPNMVGGITGLLGLIAGIPGLGFVGRELANRSNFTNDQAAMFGNVGLRDTTDPSNLSGLIGQTATTGPTGTGGQASSAAASAAAAASAMGYSNEAIAAASQAAANAAIGGASAADAAALGSAAAQTVANDIDAISATQGFTPGSGVSDPGETASNAADAAAAAAADANQGAAVGGDVGSISDQNTGGDGGGYGGYSDSAGSDSFGGGEYNMGGLVDRVGGPNPAGPDDGAGMLQLGEYVIKKSAVKKYGAGLLGMINDGKIPAKKMKSLLG